MTTLGLIVPVKENFPSQVPDEQHTAEAETSATPQPKKLVYTAYVDGWAVCFLSAMAIAARGMRITFPEDAAVNAEIDLYSIGDEYDLAACLNISLPGISRDAALALADAADWICPYSRAMRNNVNVAINAV
jgi:Ohr subfamily peroxiredoxin